MKKISIHELLKKENNNFELLRLIAALMVIYGHAYAITPQAPLTDYLGSIISGDYSGSIAVKFFFLLSGLVVTNSLLNSRNYVKFLISRLVRIFPALIFCAFATCFIFSTILSTEDFASYLKNKETLKYFTGAITLRPIWDLPGVFKNNPISTINGSLWTLPNEMLCYIVLTAIGLIFNLKSGKIPFLLAISFSIIILILLYCGSIPYPQAAKSEIFSMRIYFFSGALLATMKNRLVLSAQTSLIFVALIILSRGTPAFEILVIPASFAVILWISSLNLTRKIRLPGDYSYGVYLYGFFIQQAVKEINPTMDLRLHQIISMIIALFFGIVSWHAIEWPAMKLWRKLL